MNKPYEGMDREYNSLHQELEDRLNVNEKDIFEKVIYFREIHRLNQNKIAMSENNLLLSKICKDYLDTLETGCYDEFIELEPWFANVPEKDRDKTLEKGMDVDLEILQYLEENAEEEKNDK